MIHLRLHLPYPPSVNTYWRHNRGRTHISPEGVAYRRDVAAVVATARCVPGFGAKKRLAVSIGVVPPDKRRRDLDNTLKALLDALAHAGVYADDSQIDRLLVERRETQRDGAHVLVDVEAM